MEVVQTNWIKGSQKRRKEKATGIRLENRAATQQNQKWSLDFVADALSNGKRIRLLNVVDDFTRECLKIVVDTSWTYAKTIEIVGFCNCSMR